jgi:cbb3-type cytochrome oxidase subunit 3
MTKNIYSLILLCFLILAPLTVVRAGLSDSFSSTSPLETTAVAAGYNVTSNNNNALALASSIIAIALTFLGTIFLALIIYAGVTWMLAEGNEQRAEKARNILNQAIVGLIIVVGAYGISYALLQVFSGQLK